MFLLINSLPGSLNALNEKGVDIIPLLCARRVFGSGHLEVVIVEMMVSEVHVTQLEHVSCGQATIEFSWLMHYLVSNGKLCCIQVHECEYRCDQWPYCENIEGVCFEVIQRLEECCPVKDHGCV